MTTYRVDLCAQFSKLAELEAGEFSGRVRNLAAGDWRATTPLSALGDVVPDDVDSVMVFDESTQPARIVFAGIVLRPDGSNSSVTREVTPAGTVVTWQGIDIWGLLGCRLVWPVPSTLPPWASGYDSRTGVASTVAAGLIADHIGSTALSSRSIAGLTVVDPAIGVSGTWSFRLLPLSEAVAQVCREAGIGCIASMSASGVIEFTLRSFNDVSARHVFSDQGDLEQLTRLVVPASATWVLAAGSGELAARLFETADAGATGLSRVESLYDVSNVPASPALSRAAVAELDYRSDDVVVDGQLADGAAQRLVWHDDYEVGDWLGVEVDSVRYRAQVDQVDVSITPARTRVRPLLGRAAAGPVQALVRDVSGLAARFERNIN